MEMTIEERIGKRTLANLFTSVWLGDWDQYEETIGHLPEEVIIQLPFHRFYNRDQVALWHENYFEIPGDHFVPPYYTAYSENSENQEAWRHNLLGLIGMYEKYGFYYPLDKESYPDHIGCMTAFISSAVQEQIKASESGDREAVKEMEKVEEEVVNQYLLPTYVPFLQVTENKIHHPYFKEFIRFYGETMLQIEAS